MSTARYIVGDVFDVLASMPDDSVDLVLTSPPFLALRSYLPADHPDKAKEIGSEPTPADFLDTLLALTAEWERVLTPTGSIAVELGDTYSGSGGAGGDYNDDGLRDGQEKFSGSARRGSGEDWPMPKSLCGIPWLYTLSLAYGRNLLTGVPSPAGQWRVRNVVAWVRPNPPVGALGDKFRPATSYMTVATKARDRWFDLDAVRTELKPGSEVPRSYAEGSKTDATNGAAKIRKNNDGQMSNPAGAPPLDWWNISTEPYSGSHYATWPRKLCRIPIESMCPREVCTECGEPRRRIVETRRVDANGDTVCGDWNADNYEKGVGYTGSQGAHARRSGMAVATERNDLGWSVCDCPPPRTYRRGIVLDPFAGSGTTLAVATGLGRDAIGIDLDARNADLAAERIGMFLTVEAPA